MTRLCSTLLAAILVLSIADTAHAASKPAALGFKAQGTAKQPPSCTAGTNGDSKCITWLCDADGVCVENGSYCVSGQTGKRIPC